MEVERSCSDGENTSVCFGSVKSCGYDGEHTHSEGKTTLAGRTLSNNDVADRFLESAVIQERDTVSSPVDA
jgi:hypothetical protein